MSTITLTSPTLKKLSDINQNTYYLLKDSNSDEAYFCFSNAVVTGWDLLEQASEQNADLPTLTL